ncbi:HD domain-containing protein [Patescibacteria group bacterium]|nr:HD domain-containing protein [Patescibacteria group bacterium]
MKISDLYQDYNILPELQLHMRRVAGVAAQICDGFTGPPVNKSLIISACLLHDMGNIIKFDLTKYTQYLKPKGLVYWQNIQNRYLKKYGSNEHLATLMILDELAVSPQVHEYVAAINLTYARENYLNSDFGKKICEYADNRVSPQGVTSQKTRLYDLAARYRTNHHDDLEYEPWEKLYQYCQQIEQQIFVHCDISPDEITNESVSDTIDSLKNFVIVTKS